MGGLHFHRCPGCKNEWRCVDHSCYRNNVKYDIFCHGSRCIEDISVKKEEKPAPPEEPSFMWPNPED